MVGFELGIEADSSSLPDFLPQSHERAACLGDSVVDLMQCQCWHCECVCCQVSTACSICPFTVIYGSWYCLFGAGWYITSVFLVLMVRLKFLQAVEKLSISACISCSLLALMAQSSVKRKSLRTVSFTFVTACSLLGLNSFPSDQYLMLCQDHSP